MRKPPLVAARASPSVINIPWVTLSVAGALEKQDVHRRRHTIAHSSADPDDTSRPRQTTDVETRDRRREETQQYTGSRTAADDIGRPHPKTQADTDVETRQTRKLAVQAESQATCHQRDRCDNSRAPHTTRIPLTPVAPAAPAAPAALAAAPPRIAGRSDAPGLGAARPLCGPGAAPAPWWQPPRRRGPSRSLRPAARSARRWRACASCRLRTHIRARLR
jgi:hypothetical protein